MTRTATGSIDAARGRRWSIVVQVALAVVLLSAAGLLARSYREIYDIDAGFHTDRVLAIRVRVPPPERDRAAEPDRIDRLVRAIEAAPGVTRAGAVLGIPFGHGAGSGGFEIDGRPPLPPNERPSARIQAATPGYFEALGTPILRGRDFTDSDRASALPVAVVNQAFAEQFFPGEDPIGRAVMIDSVRWEIVGLARTVFHGNQEEISTPEIYRPMQQWARPFVWVAVRTRVDPAQLGRAAAAAVRRFDPDIPVTRLLTMNELRAGSMSSERMMLRLIAAFAIAAVLISAIGLYGLISYSVAQRTREFGVRMALGAGGGSVLRLVLGQGIRLVALGVVLGTVGALGAGRVIRSLLFRVSPTDPLTLGVVILLICAVALVAAYLPARRATLVDPMISLRHE